ncbi:MAG: D-2-hydroxyacid dehydrogenase [Gammaproteobacteria bacterium]|nr:MAG: D-2-hydroxyacid dehydrogenase [Gammaproteobacteria bacterium]
MNIVLLDRDTFARDVRFASVADCRWREWPATRPEEVTARAAEAEVVLTNKVRITAGHMAALPRLRLIAATATGVDNIDIEAARRCGIAVANVRGYAVNTVPEHVFALMLALRRSLFGYRDDLRAGHWSRSNVFCLLTQPIRDLAGATLGVVGGGSLGQAVARLGAAFGMRVLLAERRGVATVRPGYAPFEQVLTEADVLTLHLPLTSETHHLIGASELARMKRDAVLINTARGALVDPQALLAALKSGHLGGAGIDVLDVEPPPADHPLLAVDLPNLIVTPHVAWASLEAQQRLADEVMANVAAFARGESRNRVV